MADFPTGLIPTGRTFIQGAYPYTAHLVLTGRETRIRHSNTSTGHRLRLAFTLLTTAELYSIRDHYAGRLGGFFPFVIPDDLLIGTTAPADFTPTGHRWIYAASPKVTDVPIESGSPLNRHNVEVELECIPPENLMIGGLNISAVASWAPGRALTVTQYLAVVSWAPGAAFGSAAGLSQTATATWAPGLAPTPGLSATAVATWSPGERIPADPLFASVALLLPMNGANGSTTFTDASSSPKTFTRSGSVQISTAQSKFGGASAEFSGSGGTLSASSWIYISGDFTIECLMYSTSTADQIIGGHGVQNVQVFRINDSGTGNMSFFLNGTQVFNPTPAGITTYQWQHLAICRSGSSTRMFVDGGQIGATNTSWTGAFFFNVVGGMFSNNFLGYLDEFRVTTAARYVANFTPPAAPFPTF